MLFLQVQLPNEKGFVRIYTDLSSISTSVFLPLKYAFFYFQNIFTVFLVYLSTIKTVESLLILLSICYNEENCQ